MSQIGIHLGGTAYVYCVHDRMKRTILDLSFNPDYDKVQLCPCCENLFLTRDDVPAFCLGCGGRPIHPLGGPLPEPKGVIS